MGGNRHLCFDADALVNLVGLSCVDETLEIVGVAPDQCFFLPSILGRIRRPKWLADRWPRLDPEQLAHCVRRFKPLPPAPDLELQAALNSIDIEAMDAALLASMFYERDLCLLTGDGRMLRALHGLDGQEKLKESVYGRFVFFPQLLPRLMDLVTLVELEERWRRAENSGHRTLGIIFGTPPTREEDFRRAVTMQVQHVTGFCGSSILCSL